MFEVDDAMLQTLDKLEGHPSWYLRCTRKVSVTTETDDRSATREDSVMDCQVYVMHNFKKSLMNLPHLSLYSSYSEDGKPIDLSVEDELSDKLSDNLLRELKEP